MKLTEWRKMHTFHDMTKQKRERPRPRPRPYSNLLEWLDFNLSYICVMYAIRHGVIRNCSNVFYLIDFCHCQISSLFHIIIESFIFIPSIFVFSFFWSR